MVEGGSETLVATIAPTNATNKSVTWSSSNSSVASVDANGKVTALAVGNATITVTTADGGKTANATVIVERAAPSAPTSFKIEKIYQRDAIISWVDNESEEWLIEVGEHSLTSNEPILWLKNLEPDMEYEIKIYSKDGDKVSEPLIASVKTEALSSETHKIPHLYEMKEFFEMGDLLPVIWKDLENPKLEMTYHLSKGINENTQKVFSPLPEKISLNEKGSFTLTIKIGDEWDIFYKIEVK